MHEDFTNRVIAKINAPDLFERYLVSKGFFPYNRKTTSTMVDYVPSLKNGENLNLPPKFLVSMFGNICDVYQPAESKFEITRKLLKVAYDYGFPIRLLTKSNLVQRDIDLLKDIHADSFARVAMTITLANERNQKIFEPNASTTEERFDTIKELRKAGISAGIYITPVIPFIGDTKDNLHSIFRLAKESDAEFIISGGLTLRPGRNKNEFFHTLEQHFPEILPHYQKLYGNNHKGGQPDPKVAEEFNLIDIIKTGYLLSKEYGITFYEPRYIPYGQKWKNLQISTALSRIAFLKEKIFNENENIMDIRKAASYIEKMTENLETMDEIGIKSLPFNHKTSDIIREILFFNKCSYLDENNDWKNLLYHR
jgi:DNA repair photolyase